jgi:hypothetical protein
VPAGEDRAHPLAAAGAERGAAEDEERHVGADVAGDLGEIGPAHAGAPQLVAGDQGGGRVGAAPGQAGRDRDLLAQVQPGERLALGVAGQRPGGPQHEIVVVEGQLTGALTLHRQREPVAAPDGHLVVERDGVVDGHQLVVAVGADRPDVEV